VAEIEDVKVAVETVAAVKIVKNAPAAVASTTAMPRVVIIAAAQLHVKISQASLDCDPKITVTA
jgi:hypothetical protein